MARTRGVAVPMPKLSAAYTDGGELLGKDGQPLPTTPVRSGGVPALHPHHGDVAFSVAPPVPAPTMESAPAVAYEWVCDLTTIRRGVDPWVLAKLFDAFLRARIGEGFSFTLTDAEAQTLGADCKQQMQRRVLK